MIVLIVLFAIFAYFIFERGLLLPVNAGVRILMYHRILPKNQIIQNSLIKDGLVTSTEQFEQQLLWLKNNGYRFISGTDWMTIAIQSQSQPIDSKMVMITFDDGYADNYLYAHPILKKHSIPATLFLTTSFLDLDAKYLKAEQLKAMMNDQVWTVAYHSHAHPNYAELAIRDFELLKHDLSKMIEASKRMGVSFLPIFAYPFGAYCKKNSKLQQNLFDILKQFGVQYAFKIGNRVQSLPVVKPDQVQRIDIKGTDSFSIFKIKIKKGRAKIF